MWAWRYVDRIALDDLRRVELPDPTPPGPNEVTLRMRAAALNFRDLAIASGKYHASARPPLTLLSDGAGEVIAAGAEVTRFRIGDLACPVYMPDWCDGPISPGAARRRLGGPSDGVLAELMVLHEEEVVRAPAHMSAEEAATLAVAGVTAYHTLFEMGEVKPGQTVVVQGSGGVSAAAVQLAVAGGAEVISLVRGDRNAKGLRELGAREVVTLGATDAWPAEVLRLTRGGADTILTIAGGRVLDFALRALRVGGRILLVGYAGSTTASLDIFEAIRHAATIHIATAGHRRSFEAMVQLMENAMLRPAISQTYPLTEIQLALQALARGGQLGKIVLTFP
jgi:NADPH:quinone reductase-like Zn-dependent oxidoreductase